MLLFEWHVIDKKSNEKKLFFRKSNTTFHAKAKFLSEELHSEILQINILNRQRRIQIDSK